MPEAFRSLVPWSPLIRETFRAGTIAGIAMIPFAAVYPSLFIHLVYGLAVAAMARTDRLRG
jgi:hypothetical protein